MIEMKVESIIKYSKVKMEAFFQQMTDIDNIKFLSLEAVMNGRLYEMLIYPSKSGDIKISIYRDAVEYQVFAEINDCFSVGRHKKKLEAVRRAVKELIDAYEMINP